MKANGCVFCTHRGKTPSLVEGIHVYAVPDKYPVAPGHLLIATHEHLPCLAAASDQVLGELVATKERMERFLANAYGGHAWAWENGVVGQTVFHAHLHLFPLQNLPAWPEAFATAVRAENIWDTARMAYREQGSYRLVEILDQRLVWPGQSLTGVEPFLSFLEEASGREVRWARSERQGEVDELLFRWRAWHD